MIVPSIRPSVAALVTLFAFWLIFSPNSFAQGPPSPPANPAYPMTQAQATSTTGQQTAKEIQTASAKAHPDPEDAAYKTILDTRPDDTERRILLGQQYIQNYPTGKYAEPVYAEMTSAEYAEQDFSKMNAYAEKALALNPEDITVLVLVGWGIPHNYKPNDPDAESRLELAEKYEKRALVLLSALTKSGNMTKEQLDMAKAQLESQAHSALGLIYYCRHDFERSIAELKTATADRANQDPTDYYVMGVDLTQLKRISESADAFEKCAEILGPLRDRCRQRGEQAKQLAAAQPAPAKP